MNNKLIKEALKDIKEWHKDFPQADERTMKYWFRRFYSAGYIAGLEWSIENRKKHANK